MNQATKSQTRNKSSQSQGRTDAKHAKTKENKAQPNNSEGSTKPSGNYTKFSSNLFKGNRYIERFLCEVKADKYSFKCMLCKDTNGKLGKILQVNSLRSHIASKEHKNNTPQKDLKQYEDLLKLFQEEVENEDNEELGQENISDKELKEYLSFIAFLLSQNLSFSQIEAIGKYLQKASKEKKLKLLLTNSFDQRFISKISQNCFKIKAEEDLKQKLENYPYSLIIDNSTFSGVNVCALKVKYLEKEWQETLKTNVTTVKNKVIAISDLEESSTGKSLKEIVETKLFSNEKIKKHMIGLAHDNGSSLVGENIGLINLLTKDGSSFFDLKDPCHGLSLVLKHSLKSLPDEIMQFVSCISNHFGSPQRKSLLKKIQEENGLKILFPKKLATTRWLSIGDCVARLIEIWESIIKYFEVFVPERKTVKKEKKKSSKERDECSTSKKLNSKELKDLLNNKIFYIKIILFSYIVNILNKYNIRFQSQKLSVSEIKKNIHECYYSFLELVLKPSLLIKTMAEYLSYDWEDTCTQGESFLDPQEFIDSLRSDISSKFDIIKAEKDQIQEEFVYIFHDFIGKILNLLKKYLPFEDKLVDILDFVEFKDPLPIVKEKLKEFCNYFNLLSEEEKPKLTEELIQLKSIKVDYYRRLSFNILHMWDQIQEREGLSLIPRIIRFAESLPTTSAGIEQSFSQIKLVKSDIRNRLHEATLEGIILISQEFSDHQKISVDEKMIHLFKKTKKEFNLKKVVKKNTEPKKTDSIEKVPIEEKEPFDSIDNQIYQDQFEVVLVFIKDF